MRHGGRVFRCDQCDFKTNTTLNLKSPIRPVHTAAKFLCKFCSFISDTNQELEDHKQIVHVKEGCDFTASQQVQVRQHIDAKHKGLGHYCDVCDYSAALATSVGIHKLRVYNVLVLQTWEHHASWPAVTTL